MYHIIVATCKNNGIGYENKIPWNLYEDMKLFAKKTKGKGNNAIIMGRKTWESLPVKPLPKRMNIICSKTINIQEENTKTFESIETILNYCENSNFDDIWIIGGEAIYKAFLPHATSIHITCINEYYHCDTFFPTIPKSDFHLESYEALTSNSVIYKYLKKT
tara:strand:+ start:2639 stop:3124 length:486 start_codon:yes stop_codon:yes gene_type:complete